MSWLFSSGRSDYDDDCYYTGSPGRGLRLSSRQQEELLDELEDAKGRILVLEREKEVIIKRYRKYDRFVDKTIKEMEEEKASMASSKQVMDAENARLKEECKGLRSLIREEDACSGAEVKQALTDLKVRINGVANMLLDQWELDRPPHAVPSKVPNSLKKLFGQQMVDVLCKSNSAAQANVTSYLPQACIVHYLADAFESFCFGLPDNFNDLLARMHRNMSENEQPLVANQWRILAHSYATSMDQNYEKAAATQISTALLGLLKDIDIFMGGKGEIDGDYKQDLDDVADAAVSLMLMIKEKVTATGYKLCAPKSGPLDPRTMQDALKPQGSNPGHVVCTAEIGLIEVIRKAHGDTFEETETVILKAKVILDTEL